MKKIIIILSLLFVLVSCKKSSNETTNTKLETTKNEVIESESEKETQEVPKLIGIDQDLRDKGINTSPTAEVDYAFPLEFIPFLKNSDIIAYVEVLNKEGSFMRGNGGFPTTAVRVKVLNIIKGKNIKDIMTISISGGTVTLKEYSDNDKSDSQNLKNLPLDELNSKYIALYGNYYTEFKKNGKYIVFLSEYTDDKTKKTMYYINCDGFGIYEEINGKFYNEHRNEYRTLEEIEKLSN